MVEGDATTLEQDKLGQYRDMVCRFLLFLLRDPDAAEDMTQETFRVAVSKGPDLEKGANYGAWLRSIARNLVRNHIRKQHDRRFVLHGDMLELAESHFVATGSDQDDIWQARRQALANCMEKLSDDQRHLLRRRYELGEKIQDVAGELRVEPNSLSKRLERMRESLRKCIDAALKGEPGD